MTGNEQTLLHRWFEEVWNKGRAEAIDEMLALEVRRHGLKDVSGKDVKGVADFKSFYENFRSAFPDIKMVVEDTLTKEDNIVARIRITGTHQGEGLGVPPTHKQVTFTGICWARVADNKIVESWNNLDFLSMFKQLGIIRLPAE